MYNYAPASNYAFPALRPEQYVRPTVETPVLPIQQNKSSDSVIAVENLKWTLLVAQARRCENFENYPQAEILWLRALDVTHEFSLRDTRVTDTLKNISNFYYRLGEFDKAENYALMEAELTHRAHGGSHIRAANSMNSLGAIYFAQESFPAAELCFRQALRVYSRFYGRDDKRTMQATQSLALVIARQGKKELAMRYFLQAYQTSEKVYGENNPFGRMIVTQMASA